MRVEDFIHTPDSAMQIFYAWLILPFNKFVQIWIEAN